MLRLLGNHETMNVAGYMHYASSQEYAEYADLPGGRERAFKPGGSQQFVWVAHVSSLYVVENSLTHTKHIDSQTLEHRYEWVEMCLHRGPIRFICVNITPNIEQPSSGRK